MRLKMISLFVIGAAAFGVACSSGSPSVERQDAPVQATAEALSGGWQSTWSPLPAHTYLLGAVTLARISDDTIEAIARDLYLGLLVRSRKKGYNGAWSAWASLPDGPTIGRPAAIGLDEDLPGSNRYVLFGRKKDKRFYAMTMRGDGYPLTGWVRIAADYFGSAPAVATAGGVLWLVGRKENGSLWVSSQTLGGSPEPFAADRFSAFTQLPSMPGFTFAGDPAVSGASFWESGGPAFYSRLNDGRFATNVYYTDGTNSGWRAIGTQTFASDPAVTSSFGVQRTTLFGRTPTVNRLVQATGFFDQWAAFAQMPDPVIEGTPAVVDGTYSYGGPSGTSLVHHVVAIKPNGQLYLNSHTNVDPGGGPRLACAEVKALAQKVPHVQPVVLPPAGEVVLTTGNSLVANNVKTIDLDANPPLLGTPNPPYTANFADDDPTPPAPFVLPQLRSFRHEAFDNEFVVSGYHTYGAADYASTKGFRYLVNYNRVATGHLPAGTQWARLFDPYRDQWLENHGVTPGDWHDAADLDLVGMMTADPNFLSMASPLSPESVLMIDIEQPVLSPAALPTHADYPSAGSEADKAAFAERYYRGYAAIHTAPIDTARARGYSYVSLYGWQPFPTQFWGLADAVADPANDFAWNTYGREIYQRVDGINNSVYSFYFARENLAYTLANIDLNRRMIAGESVVKPLRPYYWTALHGGGNPGSWWYVQPARSEELRAITTMGFFTGIAGRVQWDWTGQGNYSLPQPVVADAYRMVGLPFSLAPVSGPPLTAFKRYDVIRIATVQAGIATFQRVDPTLPGTSGIAPGSPTYSLGVAQLTGYLRPNSEALAAVFEGMALAKPFEQTLRHGNVEIDVPAQQQFRDRAPVSRRVTRHGVHILVSNSPNVVYDGGAAEQIVLPNFDGRPGRTLRIPADKETRLWVLVDSPCR